LDFELDLKFKIAQMESTLINHSLELALLTLVVSRKHSLSSLWTLWGANVCL